MLFEGEDAHICRAPMPRNKEAIKDDGLEPTAILLHTSREITFRVVFFSTSDVCFTVAKNTLN